MRLNVRRHTVNQIRRYMYHSLCVRLLRCVYLFGRTHRHRQAVTNGLAVPNHTLIDCVLDEHFPNEANHRGSGGDDQQDPQAMGSMD